MPTRTEWVPPELRFDYGGVQVFFTYKDDDFDQYVNKYILTTNQTDDDGPRFDVRDIGHALEHNPLDRAPKMFVNDPLCVADLGVRDRVQLEWAAWHSEGERAAIDEILSTVIDWGWLTQEGLKMPEPMQKRRGVIVHSYAGEVGYCALTYHVSDDASVQDEEIAMLEVFLKVTKASLIENGHERVDTDALAQSVEITFTEKRMADIGFTPKEIEWRHIDLRERQSGVTAEHIGERLVTAAAVEGTDDDAAMIVIGLDVAEPGADQSVVFEATNHFDNFAEQTPDLPPPEIHDYTTEQVDAMNEAREQEDDEVKCVVHGSNDGSKTAMPDYPSGKADRIWNVSVVAGVPAITPGAAATRFFENLGDSGEVIMRVCHDDDACDDQFFFRVRSSDRSMVEMVVNADGVLVDKGSEEGSQNG